MQGFVKRFADGVFTLPAESHCDALHYVHNRFKSWAGGSTKYDQ